MNILRPSIGRNFALAVCLALPIWASAQTPETTPPPVPENATPPRTDVEKPSKRRKIPPLGLDLGVFLPTNSRAKDVFGDAWYSFGLGIGGVERAKRAGKFAPDVQLISNTRSRNRAYIAPLGVNYKIAFGNERSVLLPYASASLNFVGTYLSVPDDSIKYGFRPSYGGSIAIGATYNSNAFIEARFHEFAKVRGYDFSGLEVGAGFRF